MFPTIGALPIGELNPPIVLAVLREIESRGAIETAKRVRQRISGVFVFAIANGITQSDPAEKLGAVLKPLSKGRQPAITNLARLRAMNRKNEIGGDHLVPLAPQAISVLKALWPLTAGGTLVFPSNRHPNRPISENAIGDLHNRAGYHGHYVPHGFRAAFSTIMNEWAERHGKDHDRAVIDLMLAHVPKEKVEEAFNRAAFMPRQREIASTWADMLSEGLPEPVVLVERPAKPTGAHSRRRLPLPVGTEFRFPRLRHAA